MTNRERDKEKKQAEYAGIFEHVVVFFVVLFLLLRPKCVSECLCCGEAKVFKSVSSLKKVRQKKR